MALYRIQEYLGFKMCFGFIIRTQILGKLKEK